MFPNIKLFSEFLIDKLNKRYDLRPRKNLGRPIKNVTFDASQDKIVEDSFSQQQTQSQDLSKVERALLSFFTVEYELEKVKISIPLFERTRNPSYKQQVSK